MSPSRRWVRCSSRELQAGVATDEDMTAGTSLPRVEDMPPKNPLQVFTLLARPTQNNRIPSPSSTHISWVAHVTKVLTTPQSRVSQTSIFGPFASRIDKLHTSHGFLCV
jgi:hypothetical protein